MHNTKYTALPMTQKEVFSNSFCFKIFFYYFLILFLFYCVFLAVLRFEHFIKKKSFMSTEHGGAHK
jgi:hypothetical protein